MPEPIDRATPANAWQAFRRRHLQDYPDAAATLWLGIVLSGAAALAWAAGALIRLPAVTLAQTVLVLVLSTLASRFVLKLPRSAYAVTAADLVTFCALAAVNPAAAVLSAGIEAWIGTRRTSRRLSSWLASPAAAMAAMALCGMLFTLLRAVFVRMGLQAGAADFTALLLSATVPYLGTTIPLMSMVAMKTHRPLEPRRWLADSAWMGAVYVGQVFVAALLHLTALYFGAPVYAGAMLAVAALVLLLRRSFDRQEVERREQEVRIGVAEQEAALHQQRFEAAFAHAAIGMAVVRPSGVILQVNRAFCALVQRPEAELVGQAFDELLGAEDAAVFRRHGSMAEAGPASAVSMELTLRPRGQGPQWVSVHCSQYPEPGGDGRCMIYQLFDITSRRAAEGKLSHIAHHDALTDLANRHCFQERLARALERALADPAYRFAVLFADLDRFKMVNDSFGHEAGNELLKTTAERLRQCVRPTDLVARLGGDEFAVLLDSLADPDDGLSLAQRLLVAVSQPLLIHGLEITPGASMGVTFSALPPRTGEEMLRDADLAMYAAKGQGRGRVAVFDRSMHEQMAAKLALDADLRKAIGEGGLSQHFQPLYSLKPYRLVGFEALARWVHPQRGPVSPAEFIGLAEETGCIEAITDWVIENAVRQLSRWQQRLPEPGVLRINVNVSSRDLVRPGLITHVNSVLSRYPIAPGTLVLEITETTLMSRIEEALATMQLLKAQGVGFSIDDFGTGYSSLSYLGRLPIDSLKIDRSFVVGLADGPQNLEIVRTVVQLGRSLGRRVVAEGIETAEQLAVLRELGVNEGQGYLLSRPLKAEQADELVRVEHADLAVA